MEKLLKCINIDSVRILFWITFFINLFQEVHYIQEKTIIILLCAIVIIFNDYIRLHKELCKNKVIVSNIISTVLALVVGVIYSVDVNIYLCTLGCEVIFYRLKEKNSLWYLNLGTYIFLIFYNGISKGIIKEDFSGFIYLLIGYMLSYFFFNSMNYWAQKNNEEVRRVRKLNKELEESYLKLDNYAKMVEELTLKNERNRIGSEMHDSLGHSLTALRMQLEFAKKVIESNPNKALEVINKSEELVKKSIIELRATVYDLREGSNERFIEGLTLAIENIQASCNIEVDFDYSRNIETIGFEIKDLIYRTIQECITNSLNHGNAGKISIKLFYENNNLHLSIKDNGKGCKVLMENNGIRGIKERVEKYFGKVEIFSEEGKGFEMKVELENLTLPRSDEKVGIMS